MGKKARAFAPSKLFQPSPLSVGRPRELTLKESIFKGASLTRQGWKGLTGTNAVAYLASF
jgi:hypothetical protein